MIASELLGVRKSALNPHDRGSGAAAGAGANCPGQEPAASVRTGILRGSDVLSFAGVVGNRVQPKACTLEYFCTTVVPAHAAARARHCPPSPRQASLTTSSRRGLPPFTPHTINLADVLRRHTFGDQAEQIATSRTNSSAAERPSRCRSSTGEAASPPAHRTRRPETWAANTSRPPRAILLRVRPLSATGH